MDSSNTTNRITHRGLQSPCKQIEESRVEESSRAVRDVASRRKFLSVIAAAAGTSAALSTCSNAVAGTSSSSSPLLVYLADYSPAGNGSTDDTTPVSDALSDAEGKVLVFEENKTYKVTQALTVAENTTILGMNSALKFVVSGSVRNLELRNNTEISNLTIENAGSSPSGAGDYQCPVVVGSYSSGTGYSGITIHDVTIINNRPNGNGIFITGESNDINIDGVTFNASSNLGRGILVHWGGATSPASGTTHPYNIQISNVYATDLTYTSADSSVIFVSGAYNIHTSNVAAYNVDSGIICYAGDYGNQYASAQQAGSVGTGIQFSNISIRSAISKAVKIDGAPTVSGDSLAMPVYMESCDFAGKSGSGNGVSVANCVGPIFMGCKVSGFGSHGVAANAESKQVKFLSGEVSSCGNNGFYCHNGSGGVEQWSIIDSDIHSNNANDNGSASQSAGIFLGNISRANVVGCRFGASSGETQKYAIRIETSCVSPKIDYNHVLGVASGGVGYSVGSSSSYSINANGENNTAVSGITTFGGAPIFRIDGNGNRVFRASAAPASGTWTQGDRAYNTAPSSGGTIGWVCVSSPNTWKAFGTIA